MALRYPLILITLVLALIAMVVCWFYMRGKTNRSTKHKRGLAKPLANTARIENLPTYVRVQKRYKYLTVLLISASAVLFACVVMLASRFSESIVENPLMNNRDIMLCLDVSGSMTDSDAEVVKKFKAIAAGLTEERISMTIFDSSAVTVFPLTDDYDFVTENLDFAEKAFTNIYNPSLDRAQSREYEDFIFSGTQDGEGSSLIGEGLAACALGFDRLDQERSRSIILATDNLVYGDQIITLMQAAEMAKSSSIKLYGLNPADWSSDEPEEVASIPKPEEVVEYRNAVALTGGAYYKYENPATIPTLIDQIMSQQAVQFEGAPQIVNSDSPFVLFIVSAVATLGIGYLVWKLKL